MTEALLLEDRTRSATPVTSDLTNSDYWLGYRRGLRRAYFGARFGSAAEHDAWMALADSADAGLAARGRGYREGLRGYRMPACATRITLGAHGG
jgi:hypothetical protein